MKHLPTISLLLIGLVFSGCVSELNFEEPQPVDTKDENHFKGRFMGQYLCLDDSSLLTINKTTIVREWHFEYHTTDVEIDTSADFEIRDGKVYSKELPAYLSMEMNGDSVILKGDIFDTIFTIRENQILRFFKGNYFLNQLEADGFWTVSFMSLNKKVLSIKHINAGQDDIEKIKDLTTVGEIKDDEGKVVDYSVKPTRREIKKILRSDIFSKSNEYRKIK